jgi:starch synthase
MISALSRALALFREPLQWRLLQLQAMTREFSWDTSAAKFMALYDDVTGVTSEMDVVLHGGKKEHAA